MANKEIIKDTYKNLHLKSYSTNNPRVNHFKTTPSAAHEPRTLSRLL